MGWSLQEYRCRLPLPPKGLIWSRPHVPHNLLRETASHQNAPCEARTSNSNTGVSGGKRGLGHGLFTPSKVDVPTHRELCTWNVQRLADERLEAHAIGLGMQGVWLSWEQAVATSSAVS